MARAISPTNTIVHPVLENSNSSKSHDSSEEEDIEEANISNELQEITRYADLSSSPFQSLARRDMARRSVRSLNNSHSREEEV